MSAATRERPILFSGPMVRAILDGRKTQTRRVVKPQPAFRPETVAEITEGGRLRLEDVVRAAWEHGEGPRCPYGSPGDRLWVREAHALLPGIAGDDRPVYRADFGDSRPQPPWRASIHMPRWASRILLEVTDVRVERLQEISTEDVWAEGVQIPVTEDRRPLMRMSPNAAGKVPASYLPQGRCFPDQPPLTTDEWAMSHFADGWDELYAKRGYGWDANPWVFVIEFRRLEP